MISRLFSNIKSQIMAHKNKSNWSPYSARQKSKGKGPGSSPAPGSGETGGKNTGKVAQKHSESGARHRRSTENYSLDEAQDRLRDLFDRHGLKNVPFAQRRDLARFYQLLMDNQNERNFTRLLTLRDVGIKHFIDCLCVPRILEENGVPLLFPLMDVGTGPGFPGIPLKIAFPEERIILAEGVQKRVDFLKQVRDEFGFPYGPGTTETGPKAPLDILGRNVNEECFVSVNGVITRAVEDASNTLGNVIHALQTGGRVYLMKGPNCGPEIQPALDKWGEYFELERDIAYSIENTPNERRLLVFKKIKMHPLPDFVDLDLAWEKEHGA